MTHKAVLRKRQHIFMLIHQPQCCEVGLDTCIKIARPQVDLIKYEVAELLYYGGMEKIRLPVIVALREVINRKDVIAQ